MQPQQPQRPTDLDGIESQNEQALNQPQALESDATSFAPQRHGFGVLSWRFIVLGILLIAAIIGGVVLFSRVKNTTPTNVTSFGTVKISLAQFAPTDATASGQTLTVSGQLQVSDTLTLSPATRPAIATTGQIYFDKTTNELNYYNGSAYVALINATGTNTVNSQNLTNVTQNLSTTTINGATNAVTSLGGTTGTLALFTGSQTVGDSIISQGNNTANIAGNVNIFSNAPTSQMTIWDPATVPTVPSYIDNQAVEVGIKFQADVAGIVSGIRFYKGSLNTGTHIGNLWTSTGHLLASVTFTGETASGWQQALFAAPVAISPDTTYVISYHTNVGFYSADVNYFSAKGYDNPPLHALQNGADGSNGLSIYSATSTFPTQGSTNGANYWVDALYTANANPGTYEVSGAQITSSALANNYDIAKRSGGQVFTGINTFRNASDSTAAFVIQNAASTALFTADTVNSQIFITKLTINTDLVVEQHIVTNQIAPPAVTPQAAACTTPTGTATGGDIAGLITVTTGTGCSGTGKLATITYAKPYTTAPHIVLTAANANAAGLSVYVDNAAISNIAYDIQVAAGTITNSTTYQWYYHVIE